MAVVTPDEATAIEYLQVDWHERARMALASPAVMDYQRQRMAQHFGRGEDQMIVDERAFDVEVSLREAVLVIGAGVTVTVLTFLGAAVLARWLAGVLL